MSCYFPRYCDLSSPDFPQFTKKIHSLSSTFVYKANCSLLNTTSIIFHRHSTLLHWTTLDTRHGIVR